MPSLETDRGEDALLTTTAGLLVEQLKMIFWHNRSVGDTSMKFGMNILCKSLFQKKVLAIKNSNMAAIFFKMAASTPKTVINVHFFSNFCP